MDYRDLEKLQALKASQEKAEQRDTPNSDSHTFSLDAIISDYETKVYTIAMDLLEDPGSASEVVEEVFIKLNTEAEALNLNDELMDEEELDRLIHGYTYAATLPRLLNKRNRPLH